MIKLDLITGFLGSGKTTFLKLYAKYLIDKGERICIIENDFGAINVDMVLLSELEGENCNLEMVVGGDGLEAHKRRLKTKLISMAMLGYDRVIIEPSGIFDVDEFFDLLYEDPIDNWYEIGNVIAIVNLLQEREMSLNSRYLFMSEVAQAGSIIFSRVDECGSDAVDEMIQRLNEVMKEFGCNRNIDKNNVVAKTLKTLGVSDFDSIVKSGFNRCEHVKMPVVESQDFNTLFYFDFCMNENKLIEISRVIMSQDEFGNIHRIKGIIRTDTGEFHEINITRNDISTNVVKAERGILILIGEQLNKEKISEYLGKPSI